MFESPKNLVPRFFDGTAASYDKIVLWGTFGKDKYWKKEIVKQIPDGDSFLDLACGTGILTRRLAENFPNASVIGVDITQSYLELAKQNSSSYKNISYFHQDAELLDLPRKFDCITSSYIPKYCDPTKLVERCLKHLKPNGKIIFHDFTYPKNVTIRNLWKMYFVVLNFIGYFIPSWREAFMELPKLIKSSKWLTMYENELKKNGFGVKCISLTWKTSAILVANKSNKSI